MDIQSGSSCANGTASAIRNRPSSTGSHFADVGSGRYDFWRVSLDAFLAHPLGGLGQDNFADYYVVRGRTGEEPSWTHSLEMRLLAHTGARRLRCSSPASSPRRCALALRARRRATRPARGRWSRSALLPLVVWLIHGSVDWFWEMPALSGPALGFLGMAGSIADREIAIGPDAGVVPGIPGHRRRHAGSGPPEGERGALARRRAALGRRLAALGPWGPREMAALGRRGRRRRD